MNITEQQIKEWKEAEAKATPGPWEAKDVPGAGIQIYATVNLGKDEYGNGLQSVYELPVKPCLQIGDDGSVYAMLSYEGWRQFPSIKFQEMQKANAAFIAMARNNFGPLLEAYERLLKDKEEADRFIYDITLKLQQHRSAKQEEKDEWFQEAYRLYSKRDADRFDPAYEGRRSHV